MSGQLQRSIREALAVRFGQGFAVSLLHQLERGLRQLRERLVESGYGAYERGFDSFLEPLMTSHRRTEESVEDGVESGKIQQRLIYVKGNDLHPACDAW